MRQTRFLGFLGGLALAGGLLSLNGPLAVAASAPALPMLYPIHPIVTAVPGRVLSIPLRWSATSASFSLAVVSAENAANGGLAWAPQRSPVTSDTTDVSPFFPHPLLTRTGPDTVLLSTAIPAHAVPGIYDVGVAVQRVAHAVHTVKGQASVAVNLQTRIVDWITVQVPGVPPTGPLILGPPRMTSDTPGAVLIARLTNPRFTPAPHSHRVTVTIRTPHGALVLQDRVTLGPILPHSTVSSVPIPWPHADTGSWIVTESMAGAPPVSVPVTIGLAKGTHAASAITTVVSHAPPRPWRWMAASVAGVALLGIVFWRLRRSPTRRDSSRRRTRQPGSSSSPEARGISNDLDPRAMSSRMPQRSRRASLPPIRRRR